MMGKTRSSRWAFPATLVALVAILVVVALARIGAGPPDGQVHIDGEVFLPVETGAEYVATRSGTLAVYLGSPAPPFDHPDPPGEEQPLVQARPDWDDATWAGNVPVVYVGDVNGRAVFVHTNGTIGWIEHVSAAWFSGSEFGDQICLSVGNYDSVGGGIGFCGGGTVSGGRFVRNGVGDMDQAWVTWVDVPLGTSVVSVSMDGEVVAWQRPLGETVFFVLGPPPSQDVLLTALDQHGSDIASEFLDRIWFEGPG